MSFNVLLFLALSVSTASAEDDPNDYDHPRTDLMDYQVFQGELLLGADSSSPAVFAELSYNLVTTHFDWTGLITVDLPLKALENENAIDFRNIDIQAGGRWVMDSWRSADENGVISDTQLGVGIDVLSYERSESVNLPQDQLIGLNTDDVVRMSLRGVIASLGWTSLDQDSNEDSKTTEIKVGLGLGSYGVNAAGKESEFVSGGVIHARLMGVHIFEDRGTIRCGIIHGFSLVDQGVSTLGYATMMFRITRHWNGMISIQSHSVHLKERNWDFVGYDASNIKDFRFLFGIGYAF